MNTQCDFCQRVITNAGSLAKHKIVCKHNPNALTKSGGRTKGSQPWNKGLSKESDIRVLRSAMTYKQRIDTGDYTRKGVPHTEETKKLLSEKKKALYASGWEPICGRCKKHDHISPVAGHIKVDGTWELKVAKHLDKIGVKWCRNKRRFDYTKPDGQTSTYQPDFYVEDWQTFIEVKGYETELDRAKWTQFQFPLQIWRALKIKSLDVT